jgi:hypothetical protein
LKPENTSAIVSAVSLNIMQSCVGMKKEVSTGKLGRLWHMWLFSSPKAPHEGPFCCPSPHQDWHWDKRHALASRPRQDSLLSAQLSTVFQSQSSTVLRTLMQACRNWMDSSPLWLFLALVVASIFKLSVTLCTMVVVGCSAWSRYKAYHWLTLLMVVTPHLQKENVVLLHA